MRVQVLNSLLAEQIVLDQAAELMGVSTRHARRITTAYRERGAAALAHGHRGRRPVNATPAAVIADVVRLAGTRYQGANHTHLSEREGIDIGRTTLRRILLPTRGSVSMSAPSPFHPSTGSVASGCHERARYNRRFQVPAQCPPVRLSDPCRRICTWAKSCASNTKGEWPGTTP